MLRKWGINFLFNAPLFSTICRNLYCYFKRDAMFLFVKKLLILPNFCCSYVTILRANAASMRLMRNFLRFFFCHLAQFVGNCWQHTKKRLFLCHCWDLLSWQKYHTTSSVANDLVIQGSLEMQFGTSLSMVGGDNWMNNDCKISENDYGNTLFL